MMNNLKVNTKLTLAFVAMALLVAGTGVAGVLYTGAVADDGKEVGLRLAPTADAIMEIQLATIRAHLVTEEIMAGDETETMETVRAHLDEALEYGDALLNGGTTDKGSYLATTDAEVRSRLTDLRGHIQNMREVAEERYRDRAAGGSGAGSDADIRFDAVFDDIVQTGDALETRVNLQRDAGVAQLTQTGDEAERTMWVIIVLSFIVALLAGFLVSRHLTVPIVAAAGLSEKIADGDLGVSAGTEAGGERGDEVGVLLRSFVAMRDNIRDAMVGMQTGASELATQASQVGSTAAEYASSAAEQSSAVQEASSTIEEIRQSADAAVAGARDVVDSAEHAVASGHRGMDAIAEAVETMEGIGGRVDGIATSIQDLSERNQRIREVVETVSELAEQSNLLAVNASIEAAQAGEHGRGFGVVAAEVRNLATQSKRAAQQIRGLLVEIERATAEAVSASNEGSRRTDEGKKMIHGVRNVIEELASALERSSDRARQIAGSAAQQAQGISQVSEALRAVSETGRTHLQGVSNLENAAKELTLLGGNLKALTARYRL